MKPLNEIYGKRFFARRDKLAWRVPYLCNAVIEAFNPKTIVDVGCANGSFVKFWNEHGITAYGIEGSSEAREYFDSDKVLVFDLRKTFDSENFKINNGQFDLCISLEVAEHIEAQYASCYAYNLTLLSDLLYISAAPPGQKGHYHVNCQPKEYWDWIFKSLGYERDQEKQDRICSCLHPWHKKKEMSAYYKNALVYRRRSE